MKDINGKVVIVTGASSGIGAGIALRLGEEGAKVVVNYVSNSAAAQRVVDTIVAAGGQAIAFQADLAQPQQIAPLIEAAVAEYGCLDVLINNAGIYRMDTLETISAESIDAHFNLNVRGLLLTTQAAAKVMSAGGVIVNISSGVSKSPSPVAQVYCATKGAVDVLTRSLALALGERQIRVVGIAPGLTLTEGNTEMVQPFLDHFVEKTPLGRAGYPRDIAAAVAFAIGEDAGWITGSTIDVAGGMVF